MKWYMAYRIEAIPMILSHIQGHSLLQALLMWFSYSAAVDKISTDIARRAIPLR